MAEPADAQDLGSCPARGPGSTPGVRMLTLGDRARPAKPCYLLPGIPRLHASNSPQSERPMPVHPATILVVDDEEGVRMVISRTLQGAGFAVLEAEHGEAALVAVRSFDGPLVRLPPPETLRTRPPARDGRPRAG